MSSNTVSSNTVSSTPVEITALALPDKGSKACILSAKAFKAGLPSDWSSARKSEAFNDHCRMFSNQANRATEDLKSAGYLTKSLKQTKGGLMIQTWYLPKTVSATESAKAQLLEANAKIAAMAAKIAEMEALSSASVEAAVA